MNLLVLAMLGISATCGATGGPHAALAAMQSFAPVGAVCVGLCQLKLFYFRRLFRSTRRVKSAWSCCATGLFSPSPAAPSLTPTDVSYLIWRERAVESRWWRVKHSTMYESNCSPDVEALLLSNRRARRTTTAYEVRAVAAAALLSLFPELKRYFIERERERADESVSLVGH
jgi:hypothetical protein